MASSQDHMAATMASEPTAALPSVSITSVEDDSLPIPLSTSDETHHSGLSSCSGSEADTKPHEVPVQRPKMNPRKSSGTSIISRESPFVELESEEYDENDARTMSPRRTSEEIAHMTREARQSMLEQAKQLQVSLLAVVERVERIKSEHEKLEGGNRFLQSYIGELMHTSKITSTGAARKPKGKGRNAK